ncbi:Furin, partial, partial [Paramuricea clavata]
MLEGQRKQKKVAILGDSMLEYLNPRKLQQGLEQKITINTFSGAKIEDMNHYVKPTLCTIPDEIILHIGTNNLRNNNPAVVINAMGNLADTIARQNKDVKVTLSEVISRSDNHSMVEK